MLFYLMNFVSTTSSPEGRKLTMLHKGHGLEKSEVLWLWRDSTVRGHHVRPVYMVTSLKIGL